MEVNKTEQLQETVKKLLSPQKGIVALDESTNTAGTRLDLVGLENTEDNRRAFRGIFINAPEMNKYVSGVILFDETIRQEDQERIPFRETLENNEVVIGIKVDEGLEPAPNSENETLTKGLDGLSERLSGYYELGARFAKWRAAIPIGDDLPTQKVVDENSARMAKYALLCQEAGIVPIVEPEVLMAGSHSQARQKEVIAMVLDSLVKALQDQEVWLPGVILKTSMAVPGKNSGEEMDYEKVARDTIEVLLDTLPANIGGVVFLSGGQKTTQAFNNLSQMARLEPLPFEIACSFARALQMPAVEVWQGKSENISAAQAAFVKSLQQMSLADGGAYEEK